MFDDINRKIYNQFYLNIEFVGGQICCVVFAKSAQSQTCIWTNLKCISIFTLLLLLFWFFFNHWGTMPRCQKSHRRVLCNFQCKGLCGHCWTLHISCPIHVVVKILYKFGNRLHSKEKRPGSPLLFWI